MPILKNAQKALRSSLAKADMNRRVKSQVKTALDMVKAKPDATTAAQAYSSLDKALKRKIYHKNKVARLKSQISKLSASAPAATPITAKKPAPAEQPVTKKTSSAKTKSATKSK